MTARVDPEENESRALFRLSAIRGAEILEVGCGDGRLTRRIAPEAARIIAIDPFEPSIARARSAVTLSPKASVEFRATSFKDFAATRPSSTFDTLILSWSLCWMDWEGMVHALTESHRLLRPEGILVDIHPLVEPPVLAVLREGQRLFAEECPLQGADAYRQADQAIEDAIQAGLFAPGETTVFDFLTHAPSGAALDSHLTQASAFDQEPAEPEVELRWADLFTRADRAMSSAGSGAEVVLIERARITSVRPMA